MHDNWSDDGTPIPYDERKVENKWWNDVVCGGVDPFDSYIPDTRSFVTDLVYYTRGMETPTIFIVWSALYLIASVVKREAWLKWHPNRMFSNLYLMFVGPPSSKKSTVLDDIGLPLLQQLGRYMKDPNMKALKRMNVVKNKVTPEAMLEDMIPSNKAQFVKNADGSFAVDDKGEFVKYSPTSEVSIVLSELAVTISKRSYAEGMIQLLLDLYSPHDEWETKTVGKGSRKLKKLCTNFIGALTPSSFRDSIPEAAVGDGFLSRNIICYQQGYPRIRPIPEEVPGAPTETELGRRLAWIAENTLGEYSMDAKALAAYKQWYYAFKKRLAKAGDSATAQSRLDLHLLKTAFLLRVARYDATNNTITEQDVNDAAYLVQGTFEHSLGIVHEISHDGLALVERRVWDYLLSRTEASRKQLMRNLKVNSQQLDMVTKKLHAEEKLDVTLDEVPQSAPTNQPHEVYTVR